MTTPIAINDLGDFAAKIGVPKFVLTNYIFQADSYYRTFKLQKKSGKGYRKISAPSKDLKGIQKWITTFILRSVELSDEATGFRPGVSILDNAKVHTKQNFVCTLDLQDFFPSISAKRITAIYKSFGYSKEVAGALSRLSTFKGKLPQGAPSSPDLSNIVLRRLDARLAGFCRQANWRYTRYCDDISISGSGRISKRSIEKIKSIILSEGFRVNETKERIRNRNRRQEVTGLVVNSHVNIPRSRRKVLRAIFHQALLYPEKFTSRLEELQGHLVFFKSVRPHDKKATERYENSIKRVKIFMKNSSSST